MLALPITFSEEDHVYRDAAGRRIPSVTQIMEANRLQDYSKVKPNDLKKAQEGGKKAHEMCELDDNGWAEFYTFPEELMGYLVGWRAFKAAVGATILCTERKVWHPVHGYSGTFDGFLRDRNGVHWFIDRKTGPEDEAHEIQLAGYWEAVKVSAPEILPPGTGIDMIRFAAIHLHVDGTFTIAPHNAKRGWPLFLACLQLFQWKLKNKKIKFS